MVHALAMLDKLQMRYSSPEERAKLMKWLWIVSTGFTLLGFAVIFYLVLAK